MTDIVEVSPQEEMIQQFLGSFEIHNENARDLLAIASNPDAPTMGPALQGLDAAIKRQAALDIIEQVADSTYTATQIRSLYVSAMLKRSRWVDYAGFEITFRLLKTIRDERLASAHPANYTSVRNNEDQSFLAMAEAEAGISPSVASDIMILGDIVLPYAEDELGLPRQEVWANVKWSNLRNMLPLLRVLINQVRNTGDDRRPQARILERAAEIQRRWAADEIGTEIAPDNEALMDMNPDDQDTYLRQINDNRAEVDRWLENQNPQHRVRETVAYLLENGENMTNNDFSVLTGTRDDTPFDAVVYTENGRVLVAAEMTHEQYQNLRRITRERMRPMEVDTIGSLLEQLNAHHAD